MDDPEIVNYEYIHNVVDKFAKDVIERRISYYGMKENKASKSLVALYADIGEQIRVYFDVKIRGQKRVELEKDIFDNIVALNSASLVVEKELKQAVIEEKIENLGKRLDSTNKLLVEVLKALKKVTDKLDQNQ